MKSGNRTLHTRTPMGPRPGIRHFKPSWKGDRPQAILDVANDPVGADGIRILDQNWQWVWTDPNDHSKSGYNLNLHWRNARQNNYHYIVDHGVVRPLKPFELSRDLDKWTARQVTSWRRTPNIHSDRPWTYGAMVKLAAKHGVVIAAELKSPAYGEYATPARELVKAATAVDHPAWFMALINMRNASGKARFVHAAGGQFAVIFGTLRPSGRRRPKDYAAWKPAVARIWGRTLGAWS